jgi:protein-ribulosamine 3-kinase
MHNMPSKIDPAIISALSLDAATTTIASHGGSGFASTFKLICKKDDTEELYFVKVGKGKGAKVMFEGAF